jgi:hypothetical protein
MNEIVCIKGPNNTLIPATDEDAARIAKYKLGRGVSLRSVSMTQRNLKFHQKLIMLFKLCYDRFSEMVDTGIEYKGQLVKPSFEVFRGELVILAGHYTVAHSLNGGVRVFPKSISYKNRSDEDKEKIYSDVINAALKHVYSGNMPEEELRHTVDQLLSFDS